MDAARKGYLSRRSFLTSAAGASIGYSVLVRAGEFADGGLAGARDGDDIRAALERLSPAASLDERLAGEPNMRAVELECDVLVAGGGMAGVCAALAAARHGASVILVQDRSRLGGNASSEVRMHIVGADHSGNRPGWREGGILEELRLENAARNSHHAWELWDLMLYDKVVSEPGITLLLDSSVYGARTDDGIIREVLIRCDKTEHIYRIKPKLCADCTGDCRLGLEAGAKIRTGHEGRAEFGEPLAPETGGPGTLGSSVLFTAKNYHMPMPFTPPRWARKLSKEHFQFRRIRSWEYGYWWIEWGGGHDAIHDNERIRFELLSIVMGVWDYIKNSGEFPESVTWAMDWVGMIPGKRASRRLEGPHILTQQDLMSQTPPFDDAVAIGGWPFDNHPPAGFDDPSIPPFESITIDEVYNIPLRALYSINIQNLFMAGRNISASHVAFTSTRVMATCAVEGQAIGTAAALCARDGMLPARLYADKAKLKKYQQTLLRDDQTIKGLKNEDTDDLARRATAAASSEIEGSQAANVLNGFVRNMSGESSNRWIGAMGPDGAWLELRWETLQTLSQIQITFDSGFHRVLTLTEQQDYRDKQITGAQPEIVRDYAISALEPGGQWRVIASETGNYQRLRRFRFESVNTTAIRIHIQATNGAPEARIYEVRCYT